MYNYYLHIDCRRGIPSLLSTDSFSFLVFPQIEDLINGHMRPTLPPKACETPLFSLRGVVASEISHNSYLVGISATFSHNIGDVSSSALAKDAILDQTTNLPPFAPYTMASHAERLSIQQQQISEFPFYNKSMQLKLFVCMRR
jgi:hypothetical protein